MSSHKIATCRKKIPGSFSLRPKVPRGGLFIAKSKGVKFVLGTPMRRRKRLPIPLMALVRHHLTGQTRKIQVHTVDHKLDREIRCSWVADSSHFLPPSFTSHLNSVVPFILLSSSFPPPLIPEQLINSALPFRWSFFASSCGVSFALLVLLSI